MIILRKPSVKSKKGKPSKGNKRKAFGCVEYLKGSDDVGLNVAQDAGVAGVAQNQPIGRQESKRR